MAGGCILADFSRAHSTPARSSGEAEWYSQVTRASEALHLQHVMQFLLDVPIGIELWTDSTSAKAIGVRQGVGKVRHLDVQTLWLQQKVKQRIIVMRKVNTKENLADLGTKCHGEIDF
eukprot:4010526-Heterocapsa_arctica.AAC.1